MSSNIHTSGLSGKDYTYYDDQLLMYYKQKQAWFNAVTQQDLDWERPASVIYANSGAEVVQLGDISKKKDKLSSIIAYFYTR